MAALAKKGITLTNFYGATHPSQPNYVAVQGGDFFGMDSNDFKSLPYNVSNVWVSNALNVPERCYNEHFDTSVGLTAL